VAYNLSATGPETERARIACDRIGRCRGYRCSCRATWHSCYKGVRGATPGPHQASWEAACTRVVCLCSAARHLNAYGDYGTHVTRWRSRASCNARNVTQCPAFARPLACIPVASVSSASLVRTELAVGCPQPPRNWPPGVDNCDRAPKGRWNALPLQPIGRSSSSCIELAAAPSICRCLPWCDTAICVCAA
jgi:hypothetical protein